MYNLIQIQDAIRGLPIQDVMKYARGANPDVPAYLALAELNRRKQIQETSSAFYGEPQTVREQIESSLTGAPQGQVNPAAAPQMANPTTPPQLQTLTAPPPKPQMPAMPMVPPQVNPTQAPPVPQMRKGGLASLPVGMFKRANYAGGGIIAFDEGTKDATVEEAARRQREEERRKQLEADRASISGATRSIGAAAKDILTLPQRAAAGVINTGIRGVRAVTGADIPYLYQDNPEMLESMTPYYDRDVRKDDVDRAEAQKRQTQMESQDRQEGSESRTATPNRQASATTSGQISTREPAKPLFGQKVTITQPDLTDEQLFERRRKLQELAGVSADPYADIKKRYADIEARRKADEEGDTMRSVTAGLRGFAQAKATDPFGVQLAAAGDKMAALDKEQTALRDKQATAMAELQLGIAKEDDARRRGDVTAIENARAAQEKAKMDLAKLEIDRMNAESSRISATRPAAEIQMIERVMKDKNMTFTEAAEYLQSVKGINALRTAADKEWNESLSLRMEWEKKGGYPAYMASKGLSVGGAGAAPTGGAPKEGDKATSKSGKPIVFRNGQWEYQ